MVGRAFVGRASRPPTSSGQPGMAAYQNRTPYPAGTSTKSKVAWL